MRHGFERFGVELMAVFLARYFVSYIPIRVSRVCSSTVLNFPIRNRLSLCTITNTCVEETTDEFLNQILAAGEDPSLTRDHCVDYIRKLCAAGNFQAAAKLPQKLRGKHIFLGPHAFDRILEAAEIRNDIGVISQVFKDLLVSCGCIRFNSYLIVARAFGNQNTPAMLLDFVREICEMELPRIDIVLNRFIHALAKCGHSGDAILVFENMRSLGCKPDLVTYNTVLAILGRLGEVDKMLRVFASMGSVHLVPDIVTYNTVLNSLRKMGRLDLCLVHFKEMTERGIQPDLLSFKPLIESLGRSGNIEEALNIFDEMKRMGIQPSVHIYRALIFSLKKMGKMELALKFSREMNALLPGFSTRSYTQN